MTLPSLVTASLWSRSSSPAWPKTSKAMTFVTSVGTGQRGSTSRSMTRPYVLSPGSNTSLSREPVAIRVDHRQLVVVIVSLIVRPTGGMTSPHSKGASQPVGTFGRHHECVTVRSRRGIFL